MPLHAVLLSSALVAAALDGAAAPQKNHHMIVAEPAAPVELEGDDPWALSGPILDLDIAGAGLVALCGGLLWFFGPTERAGQRRPVRRVRSFGVPVRETLRPAARSHRPWP